MPERMFGFFLRNGGSFSDLGLVSNRRADKVSKMFPSVRAEDVRTRTETTQAENDGETEHLYSDENHMCGITT